MRQPIATPNRRTKTRPIRLTVLAIVPALVALTVGLLGGAPATAAGTPVRAHSESAATKAAETVVVDGASTGRTYDGIGAVSAGASSRLLHDYPQPERRQILDYLFKPNYGAAMQNLKVEIGGDTNSTSGSEPSHERERGQVDCDRGYEWWLMKEARKRNPDIKLGGLQWGAPGWFEGGFWSQDNIDYLLSWLDCAKKQGIRIDYMGGWNEAGYDADWLVKWRRALKRHYPEVELNAADDVPNHGWRIADDMAKNPELGNAVDVANLHSPCGHRALYKECETTETARGLDKPLWIGELSAMAHDAGAEPLARVANRMYVDAKLTGMTAWPPLSAWYSNITLADTGLITAEWPWSGYYDVGDSVWSYAHTTQFAQPGWRYLDSGSTRLKSGATQTALVSPSGKDWSAVIEAMDVTEPTELTLDVRNLPTERPLKLWSTDLRSDNDADRFRAEGAVESGDGSVTLRLEPGHVYSLTTTRGQHKGDAKPRATVEDRLELPYRQDFEKVDHGELAPYFSDLGGAFEAAPCGGDRDGTCYRQMTPRKPISWGLVGDVPLSTMVGDPRWWGDYAVTADVRLREKGYVELGGRVSGQSWGTPASGYHLRVGTDGWKLLSRDHATKLETTVAEGDQRIAVGKWHEVSLRMTDDLLQVYVDGERIGQARDTAQRTGNVVLGVSGWDGDDATGGQAEFDDVRVEPTAKQPARVAANELTASASSEHGFDRGWTYGAEHVVDDRPETSWSSKFNPAAGLPQSVTVDMGETRSLEALTYQPRLDGLTGGMIRNYEVQVSTNGEEFRTVGKGSWPRGASTKVATWKATEARYVRLIARDDEVCGEATASAGELGLVTEAGEHLSPTPPPEEEPALPDDAPPEFEHLVPGSSLTARASSEHGTPNIACKAIDADRATFWHSAPAATKPLPASLTFELDAERPVRGLAYLPRQDGNPNGNITAYDVQVSSDGEEFRTVTGGEWADNANRKYVTWEPTDARYVRLTARAGHFDVASAAEVHLATTP